MIIRTILSMTTLLIALFITGISSADEVKKIELRQYYELRVYTTPSEEQQNQVNEFWETTAVSAYNRMGINPIGVFTELEESRNVYVLIPFNSFGAFEGVAAKLASDPIYQKSADKFLNAAKENPAYESFESSLLVAFNGMKQMKVPSERDDTNVFELRKYISASENKGRNKIQMFEDGEISLMKDVGLAPIFFSQTLIGTQMPNLVYMTSGEDLIEHEKHWKAFSQSPIWEKLKNDPQYKDNMNAMVRNLLKRTSASQI